MARYHRGSGRNRQIWEIEVDGADWTITYGRVNKPLEVYQRSYPTPAIAAAEAERMLASRIADGYKLVEPEPPRPPRAPPSELEQQVFAHPDDVDPYLVLADSLQATGDPRGRLIVVQHQLATAEADRREALAAEERAILEEHRQVLLGDLARYSPDTTQLTWRLGFLDGIHLRFDPSPDAHGVDVLGSLLRLPEAALVREIRVGLSEDGCSSVVDQLAANARLLPRLRRLIVGDFAFPDESEISWVELGEIWQLYAAFPQLELLHLTGGSMNLGSTIELPALRDFALVTGGLAPSTLHSITSAHWPALERLVLWLGNEDHGGGATLDDVAPILAAHGLGHVRHLGLCNADFTDALCEALPASAIARQLETLDLSFGTMTDTGAVALRSFPNLRHLCVGENYLSTAGRTTLEALGIAVDFGEQRDPGEGRYPAVGE